MQIERAVGADAEARQPYGHHRDEDAERCRTLATKAPTRKGIEPALSDRRRSHRSEEASRVGLVDRVPLDEVSDALFRCAHRPTFFSSSAAAFAVSFPLSSASRIS
jgi:hypothetical protein